MKNSLYKGLLAGLLALFCQGCGSGDTTTGNAGPIDRNGEVQISLDGAILNNPELALRFAPSESLRARRAGVSNATLLSVADLETDYETLFGSLSESLGVTLSTPQVVADINFIAGQDGTGRFNLLNKPILNNPLGVTGVSFQSLEYDTTVPLPAGNQTFHVSGGLLIPQGISKAQIRGVLVYFHGTTFNKSQVPSQYEGNVETQLMAEVFASQGYVVVMPDYVGQGVDWQNAHPYVLYPQVSAKTAADMLTAVKPTLVASLGLLPGDPALKLFSVGYSEGGSYSLWFNQFLSSNPGLLDPVYVLTHSVGIEGAYNTSTITYGFLFDDVSFRRGNTYNIQTQGLTNLVKPILSADAFLSYAVYSYASDFASIFQPDFFAMTATPALLQPACNVNGQQVTIQQAFALPNTTISSQVLFAALGKTNNGATYPGLETLLLPFTTNNSINSLVSSSLLQPDFQAKLLQVLRAADLDLSAVANQGVSIVSLDQDSVVTPNNFDDLLQRFPGKIRNSYKVDHTQLQILSPFSQALGRPVFVPTDHLHALIYEFLYALNTFNQF